MSSNVYSSYLNPSTTPQSAPLPGRESDMSKNRADGYTFKISAWDQLRRFLILGSEGGTYYATEREMTLDNAKALQECIAEDGVKVVELVVDLDRENRAPKRAPLLFALGLTMGRGDQWAKSAVVEAVPGVIRTASDLFSLLSVIRDLKGGTSWWASRSVRRLISAWYNGKRPDQLAYQLVKYRQRAGFTHQDAIRIGHPKPASTEHSELLWWATHPDEKKEFGGDHARMVEGYLAAQPAETPSATASLVVEHGLSWEMLKSEHLKDPGVWESLLPSMPYRALIRNLARMSSIGLLKPLSDAEALVVGRLTDGELIRKARIHPIHALSALITYRNGRGARGSLTWTPSQGVIAALEVALENSFSAVEPTGKRFYFGVDVSGSMTLGEICGVPGLTPRIGSAILALVSAKTEPKTYIRGFSDRLIDLPITSRSSFAGAVDAVSDMLFGATDCALPMLDAAARGLDVDVFVVITDNETWHGDVHPSQALKQYRAKSGIDAKLAVIGMTATRCSIADPNDVGMMDMVGFDSSGPAILREFAAGV